MENDIRVIAELGINHKGSRQAARKLIDAAAKAGAWAVKFQYRRKDNFYEVVTEIGDEQISAELERTYLSPTAILELRQYACDSGLRVGISFFSASDAGDFEENLKSFDFYKVPSAELLNDDLLSSLVELNKLVLVSTGGHDERQTLSQVKKYSNCAQVVFMHCISNYPTLLGNQQLSFISNLREASPNPVGYSSHDKDWEVNLIAMTLGARYIERHLTFDKEGDGLDDSTSSEPHELESLCRYAALYQTIVGGGQRVVNQGERINIQNLGSSLYATRNIYRGELATTGDFELRAPRKGLTPGDFDGLSSRVVTLNICAGEPALASHFERPVVPLSTAATEFCDSYGISIPIRLHDAKKLQELFPIENFELHLSYGEVQIYKESRNSFFESIDFKKSYSVHLPDYLPGNRLIDPLSRIPAVRSDSLQLILACVRLAKELEQFSGKSVPMVGSFSRILPEGKEATYRELADFVNGIKEKDGVDILPQWLPKIAWYFGGAEELSMFCEEDDIYFALRHNLRICLDISHLILSANFAKQDWKVWYDRLIAISSHIHLADASGIDGEGVEFGAGDLSDARSILAMPPRVVLEVWQGHLSNGEGFRKAIDYLGRVNE